MNRTQKIKAIKAAQDRIAGTNHRLTEVYPVNLRRLGYIAQIQAVESTPEPGTARAITRRFDPEQLSRLNADNVRAAVIEGAQI